MKRCILMVIAAIIFLTVFPEISKSLEKQKTELSISQKSPDESLSKKITPQQGLKSTFWEVRAQSAQKLAKDHTIPAPRRFTLLFQALKDEIQQPFVPKEKEPKLFEGQLKRIYLHALNGLGKDLIKPARKILGNEMGEARWCLVILLASAGDSHIGPELINIAKDENIDLVYRRKAIYWIGERRIKEATLLLEKLLIDTTREKIKSDVVVQGMEWHYPLRESAASALNRLGYKVFPHPTEPDQYIIKGRPSQ